MSAGWSANALVLIVSAVSLAVLFLPRIQRHSTWLATVTPLASIIGSGFLVLAPLLVREFGHRAIVVMAGLCLLAYAVGAAIRWNILASERMKVTESSLPGRLDRLGSWVLASAYVISVCYYLNLFGSFAVSATPWDGKVAARTVTTLVMVLIAAIGWTRGLRGLERAESWTVSVKLAVIAGLLAGLALYAARLAGDGALQSRVVPIGWDSLFLAFGMVITVQGFETSRYLAEGYDADTRVRTMRYAQWLSSAIYLGYIGLAGFAFHADSIALRETEVISMMAPVAAVLPPLLIVVALAAQFSAAVADTNGCGGLVQEMSSERIRSRVAYVVLVAVALAMTWTVDIFRIISYASRAFSVYYAVQCAQASVLAWRERRRLPGLGFGALAVLMLIAAVTGKSAE